MMRSEPEIRYKLDIADGVYAIIDREWTPKGWRHTPFVGEDDIDPDVRIRFVHVVSTHAGGEIRGYVQVEDEPKQLRLRRDHTGPWPELDRSVEQALSVFCIVP